MNKKILLIFFIISFLAVFLIFRNARNNSSIIEDDINNALSENEEVQLIQAGEQVPMEYIKFIEDIKNDLLREKKDFLEINLHDRQARLYRQGKLLTENEFLAAGDVSNWGGSAAGLYHIKSKNRSSYSVIAKLYMPYALHYYGKYYLHGEPHYLDGTKFESDFSGGCIRFSDEDAKTLYESTETGLPVLVIDRPREHFDYLNQGIREFPIITATNYLVADLDSGFILAEKESDEAKPIASITKLMTAVIVAENINLENTITVHPSMLSVYGSIEGLEAGKTFRIVELFYPLLIESSNNAGEILSYSLGRDRMIALMNQKTAAILMTNTNFIDPHGLSAQNISSARDIFQLTRYILNNRPPLFEITRSHIVRNFGSLQFDIDQMWNKNIFSDDPNFLGGKTGFILLSRYTGTMIFQFLTSEGEIRRIAIIYLGSENAKGDIQSIYSWLMDNFSLTPIYP